MASIPPNTLSQFRDAIRAAGLNPPELIEPGKFHRFAGSGKNRGNTSGWCKLFADGRGGVFGDWSTGHVGNWQAKRNKPITVKARMAFARRVKKARVEAQAQRNAVQAEAAQKARAIWNAAPPASDDHTYLVRKQISANGARSYNESLVIPVYHDDTLYTLQFIKPNGEKYYLSGGRVSGGYFLIGEKSDEGTLCIAEGFATSATIHQATGYAVTVAFNAGNLMLVAKSFRKRFPDVSLILCADDDAATDGNPGLTKATEAANCVGAQVVYPDFGTDRPDGATDFSDLAALAGFDEIERQINGRNKKNRDIENLKNSDLPDTDDTSSSDAGFSRHRGQHCPKSDSTSQKLTVDLDGTKQNLAAKRLAETLKNCLLFNDQTGSWMYKAGNIWVSCSDISAKSEILTALEKSMPKGFSHSYFNSIASFLKTILNTSDWITVQNYLPLKNGVLNLETLTLESYSDEYKFLWQLPYDYNPAADCLTIQRWFETVTKGDVAVINLLQTWMRAVLCGDYGIQKYLELIGPGGTGKSTFIRLVITLIGPKNAISTDLKTIETNRFESANLYGKRLANISDAHRFGGECSILKQITGGDPIRHERKFQQNLPSFIYTGMVMIAANEPIQSSDYTSALARRRISVRFDYRITAKDKQRYPDGIESVMSREIPGLLNCLMSLDQSDVLETLSNPDPSIRSFNLKAELATNPVQAWMHERLVRCEPDSKPRVEPNIGRNFRKEDFGDERKLLARNCLYANYVMWCEDGNRKPVGLDRFSRLIDDLANSHGIKTEKRRDKDGRHMVGLRLRTDSDADINGLFDSQPVLADANPMSPETLASAGNVEDIDKKDSEYF